MSVGCRGRVAYRAVRHAHALWEQVDPNLCNQDVHTSFVMLVLLYPELL